jgi:DNA-binding transcriptional LysR family regulator
MDTLDALRAFLAALDEGALAAAGRRLGRSPAAMTRALAALEARAGIMLFERSTRRLRLTEAGRSYADAARRVLAEANALDGLAGLDVAPRGLLTLTAPIAAGADLLRPVLDAFLDLNPRVQARLLLLDRLTNLVEEGFDAALRIARLPDSGLIAIRVGDVRRVVCAAPAYLAARPPLQAPVDLAAHSVIALAETRQEAVWNFAGGRIQRLAPRLAVNSIAAALSSALAGHGVVRLLSYQVASEVRAGRLEIVLQDFEPAALPAHLVAPKDRLALAKTRAFVDFATPRLKAAFEAATLV